ncbi:phosphodiesterase [Pseudomonas nitroreducens]|uniref:phosphodiesterase n=1 Tax=Pseudomonas TaxID=286 RepID=UPI0005646110|nr:MULTISPECIES: phosphodiesterase [Pseudomonas]MDH1072467.1 phosphodiesterase [Pseudomonas nitroreducens]NMZ72048.1 phosphodiesterase [Pseudomonas nitroreducens]OBY57773.1 phosphodiesterase [Pseudomonas sp. AU12215]
MQIISHRGYWLEKAERNLKVAFERSFDLGFGTETDVRDVAGRLVISHDMPCGDEMSLDDLLDIMAGRNLPLAMNIKADGLCEALKSAFAARGHSNWFVFDMAVPDMRSYLAAGVSTYTRQSEVEPAPAWLNEADGIWLDSFGVEWYSRDQIADLLAGGKQICVVSSELHGREHLPLWQLLGDFQDAANLTLCTDLPESARTFFKE